MAKKAAEELTPKQKALSDAKVKLEHAEKAYEAKQSDQTKKAVADATAAVHAAAAEVRRENFVRVAGGRVKKARIALRNLGNINNTRSYAYSEADVTKAFDAISEMLNSSKQKMLDGLKVRAATPTAKDEFSF